MRILVVEAAQPFNAGQGEVLGSLLEHLPAALIAVRRALGRGK